MTALKPISLTIVLALLAVLVITADAQEHKPASNGGCGSGSGYDPACDVDHDDDIDIHDIQLTAGHWNETGTWVSDNQHDHLGQIWSGNNNPLVIQGSFGSPESASLVLGNSYPLGHGLEVDSAGLSGVQVDAAGEDGVYVHTAGNVGTTTQSGEANGFEVAGAENYGLFVGRAGYSGVYVDSAIISGVDVNSAGEDGFYVHIAGNVGTTTQSALANGFEVAGAEGHGLFVGRTGSSGIHVDWAGNDGVRIKDAADDGIQIGADNDFPNYGLYVPPDGTAYTTLLVNTAEPNGEWALETPDNISAGNVSASGHTLLAVVAGTQPVTAGDVVSAVGVADPRPGSLRHLPKVELADAQLAGVVGVVASRIEMQPAPDKEGVTIPQSVDGPARAGDFVAITVLGVTRAKVDPLDSVSAGQRLTATGTPGTVRSLGTVQVEGVELAESAPVIGVALEDLKEGEDLIWVLVNPQ